MIMTAKELLDRNPRPNAAELSSRRSSTGLTRAPIFLGRSPFSIRHRS
jgi:hypothetical protein